MRGSVFSEVRPEGVAKIGRLQMIGPSLQWRRWGQMRLKSAIAVRGETPPGPFTQCDRSLPMRTMRFSNIQMDNPPPSPNSASQVDADYREFGLVSQQLAVSYAHIARLGLPETAVAAAMLGATINLYQSFDMTDELPSILRALADRLEHTGGTS